MSDVPVCIGFQIVEILRSKTKSGKEKSTDKVVSRTFTIKQAAEMAATLMRSSGREVWVREQMGFEE